jgi:hypothetical protein
MTTSEHRDLRTELHCITTTLSVSVAIGLGQWAGLGDWNSFPADFRARARAGSRALAEIGTSITRLTELTDRLAALLDT